MGQMRSKLVAFLPHRNAAFYGKLESGRVASVFPSPRWVPLLVSHGVKRLFHGILKAELVCVRMKNFHPPTEEQHFSSSLHAVILLSVQCCTVTTSALKASASQWGHSCLAGTFRNN